jgi:hypothetical protein
MGFLPDGGYIVSTEDGSWVGKRSISRDMLLEVAKLLGIPEAKRDAVISGTRSIYIYRGTRGAPWDKGGSGGGSGSGS